MEQQADEVSERKPNFFIDESYRFASDDFMQEVKAEVFRQTIDKGGPTFAHENNL